MFEQSVLVQQPTNKGWSFLLSLGLESFLVAVAVALPLLFTNALPRVQWIDTVILPPRPAPAPAPVAARATNNSRPSAVAPRVFVAPRQIPQTIAVLNDAMPAPDVTPQSGLVGDPRGMGFVEALHGPPLPIVEPFRPAPAPITTPAAKPVRVGGSVLAAKLIHKVVPVYPALAKQARIQGAVHLMGVVAKDGTMQNLRLISGHPLLAKAAMDAVLQWVYRPTLLNGEPVEVTAPIDVTFTLSP